MWSYKILKQYKETIPVDETRLSKLDQKPLPEGALLVVEAEFTDGTPEHTYPYKDRISKEDGVEYGVTVDRLLNEKLQDYIQRDEAGKILEQAKAVDEYLASV